jgi:hypothetical protein
MARLQYGRRDRFTFVAVLLGAISVSVASQALPVLLVYGFQPLPGFRTTQLWEGFAEHLSGNNVVNAQTLELSEDHDFYYLPAVDSTHRDVFMSNYALPYEPTTRDIFFYTRRFADEIGFIQSEFGVQTLDVVGHSMGGLIARAYAEISDFANAIGEDDFRDYSIVYGGEISTLVLLATPNHGVLVASIGEWFSTLSRQLAPGSEFLQRLNETRWSDDRLDSLNPTIRYVSMAGQACLGCGLRVDEAACLRSCIDEGLSWNGSDLVVMMASAYLPEAENYALIGFDHVQNHTDGIIVAAIEAVLAGEPAPAAIYAPRLQEFKSAN